MKREMSEGWEWEDWYGANVHQLRIMIMLGIIVSLTLSNYRKLNSYTLSHKSKTQQQAPTRWLLCCAMHGF